MTGLCFDTSALVPVVSDQLIQHGAAHSRFVAALRSGAPLFCSTHALAECYATLTALPLPKRISGLEASRLIEHSFMRHLGIVELSADDYRQAILRCADRGRGSGQIYDALHVAAAIKAGCTTLLTYNAKHLHPLAPSGLRIEAP